MDAENKKRLIEAYNDLEKKLDKKMSATPSGSGGSFIKVLSRNPDGTVKDIEFILAKNAESRSIKDKLINLWMRLTKK